MYLFITNLTKSTPFATAIKIYKSPRSVNLGSYVRFQQPHI